MKIKIKEAALRLRGWSLYKLSKMLDVPQQTVYSWASGRTQPSYENMDRLCTVIGCRLGDLFESEDAKEYEANRVYNRKVQQLKSLYTEVKILESYKNEGGSAR